MAYGGGIPFPSGALWPGVLTAIANNSIYRYASCAEARADPRVFATIVITGRGDPGHRTVDRQGHLARGVRRACDGAVSLSVPLGVLHAPGAVRRAGHVYGGFDAHVWCGPTGTVGLYA